MAGEEATVRDPNVAGLPATLFTITQFCESGRLLVRSPVSPVMELSIAQRCLVKAVHVGDPS